ncbi:LOW QUALITY PROTEIN: interferon-induced 35 kDa protein [Pterocles gutturalis]
MAEQRLLHPAAPLHGARARLPGRDPRAVRQEIERCKEVCSELEQDHAKLQTAKDALEQRTRDLRKEGELLHKNLEQRLFLNRMKRCPASPSCPARSLAAPRPLPFQAGIALAKEENNRMRQEKELLKKKLEEVREEVLSVDWLGQPSGVQSPPDAVCLLEPEMLPALPEKKMVFRDLVTNKEDVNKLVLTPMVRYPLLGGSALITFEKAEVAQRIIEMKEHLVELSCGEELEELERCRMRVQAAPVDILLPSALEIRLARSSRSILVSDLPSLGIPEEALLDKLELFFSKTKNGGGEVESREFLDDSGQVVLTFAQDGGAWPLIARGHIQVLSGKGKYELKISPCMSGDIANLQPPSCCPRTVLLSGIPDVLGEETMRDTLEIHFQKSSQGGEVDALAYVPAGRQGVAVFTEDAG